METLDCAGLACPEPVLRVKARLESPGGGDFAVVVDNAAALENVSRFAVNRGCAVERRPLPGGRWEILLRPGEVSAEPAAGCTLPVELPVALLVLSDKIGSNPELGAILVRSFFVSLDKASAPPKTLILLNEGVRLACAGSPVLEELHRLEDRGVTIRSCGTCLDFLHLKEQLRAGAITNMYDIVDAITVGHRVVTVT